MFATHEFVSRALTSDWLVQAFLVAPHSPSSVDLSPIAMTPNTVPTASPTPPTTSAVNAGASDDPPPGGGAAVAVVAGAATATGAGGRGSRRSPAATSPPSGTVTTMVDDLNPGALA